jgi:GEVED domain/SdrD B-like domain/Right handed beta helix region
MQSFFEQLRQLRASKKKTVQTFTHSAEMRSQKPHHNFSPLKFPIRKGGKWMSHLLLLGTVMASPLTGVANAAPVTHLATQTATATGAGATGTPSIATFNIPSGKNRVLFIWATFERDHCSNADVTASLCVSGNTAGTGLGDNYPDPRVGTPPATTSNNQITAQVIGPGGTINKKNALVIGGTPSGDTRFINISTSPQGSPAGTAFFSVSSFHIVLFENEINTLLGGAASGTVSITLPDTVAPSNAGDDAMLIASVFQNVEQTPTGFVRNATATAQVTTGTPGNSTLSPAAYDAGQAPDEADDGKLVMGASSSTEGFLTPAGHVVLATLSVTNTSGNYDTPNGNIHNEPNGFTGGAYFRNGGATPNSLYSLQMGGVASTLVYGATNASFLLESDSSDAGDAPLSYGNPTHTLVNGIRLGASVDADAGFLNSSNATGDDTNGTDDEEGVTIPTLTQGQSATISVNVNQVTAGTGRLQGWIDWNGDGDFADAGEQIATNLQLAAGTTGTISVPVTVPAGAITSAPTFARFRWSTTTGLNSTATAIDGEVEDYQVAIAAAAPLSISGTVFEDPNYGGGAGRPLSTTNTSPRANATVELYNSTGNFVSSTITSANALSIGQYSFTGLAPGNYYVRVVNSTVSSSRPGYTSTLRSVQTFYTDASSGTPINVLNHVGGEKPSTFDTGAATTGAQLNTTNFTFTTGAGTAIAAGQAESVTPVTISSSPITGIDFGYNFDTIVNTNNSGQGSLRQFIANSNALTNTGLAQQGLTAGQENSIFMIPDGVAHPGLRSGLTNQVVGTGGNSGAAVITILSPLDAVTDTNTTIDGSTQSTNVGDTNAGQVGSAPTVGVTGMSVPRVNRPEIVIDGRNLTNSTNADQYAITLNANYSILRGLAVYGGKGNYASSTQGDSGAIRVGSTLGTNVTLAGAAIIEQNLIGTFADGSDPGSTLQNQRYGTICFGACEIKNNFLAFNGYATLLFGSGADGSKITGNEYQFNGPNIAPFTNPGMGSADGDTIGIWSASSILVEGNLIANTRGVSSNTLDGGKGIEIVDTLGHDTINNQIRNNTIDKSSTAGIGLYAGPSGNTIFQNIISNTTPTATSSGTAYVGAGILISATGADRNSASITAPDRNTISQNSIFRNMGLGIDIDPRDWYMGDGVTANTGATSNIVPNIGMNYPVMSTSSLSGSGTLSVTGYVGKETTAGSGDADFANAKLEFFIADNTPANQDGEVILGDGLSKPHGEGKTYIGTCTTDVKGLFSCSFPNAGTLGLTNARDITATATDSVGNTSEFSSILSSAPSVNNPNILLVKRITAINGATASASGQNLAAYNEEPTNAYDDNDLTVTVPPQNPSDPALDTDKWPNTTGSTASTFLIGGINGGNVKPNDEVEYTIYFLSAGPGSAKSVQMCDRIPSHQTFVPDTFNSLTAAPNTTPVLPIGDRGIEVSQGSTAYGYTNIGDGDTARYYPPGSPLPSACTQPPLPEDNGAIVVTLGDVLNATAPGTPTESYGFFRFRARVK